MNYLRFAFAFFIAALFYSATVSSLIENVNAIPDDSDKKIVALHYLGGGDDSAQALRRSGVPVLCWTIKSEAAELEARRLCDNVTFEGYPAQIEA